MLLLIALNTIRQASFLNENSGDGVSTQFCDDGYDSYNSASFSAPGFYASIWDSVYNDGCGMVHNQGVSASSSGRYSSMPGSHVPSQGGVYYDGTSPESMGIFWLRQSSESVKKSNLQRFKGTKSIRLSRRQFHIVVKTLYHSTRQTS